MSKTNTVSQKFHAPIRIHHKMARADGSPANSQADPQCQLNTRPSSKLSLHFTKAPSREFSVKDPLNIGPDPYGHNPLESGRSLSMDYVRSEPIDIGSASSRSPSSNLSSGLRMQDYSADGYQMPAGTMDDFRDDFFNDGRDSTGQGFFGASAARPIMMHERRRRESNNIDGFSNGMSLGPASLGSWIRDEVGMTGTSPVPSSAIQLSASHQSSSYLPRHESSFMRDFSCCGTVHPSPHDLLRHREECHPNQPSNEAPRNSSFNLGISSQQGLNQAFTSGPSLTVQQSSRPSHGDSSRRTQALETIMDDDALDMEMDDVPPFAPSTSGATQGQSDSMLQAISGPMGNFGLMGNPTVSSVNTPSLSTQQTANQGQGSDPSMANPTFGDMSNFGNINMFGNGLDFNMFDQGTFAQDMTGLTIHDPASQLQTNMGVNGQGEFPLPVDGNLVSALQQQQLAGVPTAFVTFPQEDKKYKCPVVGCEKAYKNQNGLKYHKTHGHANQKMISNEDGTFSIIDPVTSIPYPGSVGMEKEKPYKCDTCNKRYKNLNGLKYHRAHSAPCNPELIKALPTVLHMGNVVNIQQLQNQIQNAANPEFNMTPTGY